MSWHAPLAAVSLFALGWAACGGNVVLDGPQATGAGAAGGAGAGGLATTDVGGGGCCADCHCGIGGDFGVGGELGVGVGGQIGVGGATTGCTSNADCTNGQLCFEGSCHDVTGTACTADTDCAVGEICDTSAGFCVLLDCGPSNATCVSDNQCCSQICLGDGQCE